MSKIKPFASGSAKFLLSLVALFILTIGVLAGVILTQNTQDIRKEATPGDPPPGCNINPPTNINVTNITATTATLNWTPGTGGNYIKLWVSSNSNPTIDCLRLPNKVTDSICVANENGRLINGDSNHADIPAVPSTYQVTGMSPNTTYYWRIMMWKESGCDYAAPTISFTTTNCAADSVRTCKTVPGSVYQLVTSCYRPTICAPIGEYVSQDKYISHVGGNESTGRCYKQEDPNDSGYGEWIYNTITTCQKPSVEVCTCSPNATPTIVKPSILTPTPATCVIPPPKDPPKVICAPVGGTGSITWTWPSVPQANQYEIDIYRSNNTILINNGWLPASNFNCNSNLCSYTTGNLAVGTYYSRVRARNTSDTAGCDASAWSQSKNITITNCSPTPTKKPTGIVCNKKLDISLIIDRSGSMNSKETDGRTKLAWAKEAAVTFMNVLKAHPNNQNNVRVSVDSFGSQGNTNDPIYGNLTQSPQYKSTLNIGLTRDYSSVIAAINNIGHIKGGTCIQCGIVIANKQLTYPTSKKAAILLSDGRANHTWTGKTNSINGVSNTQAAINAANTGRSKGITYKAIGYGIKPSSINESALKAIAGNSTNYQYKPNPKDWSTSFLTILKELCQ